MLMDRDLSELAVAALMIDGVHMADHCLVVALAISVDGTKVPVGLWEGDTENTTVVTALLADLVSRGLDASSGLLVVIDSAKALAAGIGKVFGDQALVQRCTLHKRRNVTEHLPERERSFVDAKLAKAFSTRQCPRRAASRPGPRQGARGQAPRVGGIAAQGLEDMFTVRRLGLSDRLCRTLGSTNPVESMISVARTTHRNVKRWPDGRMVLRWGAAGMLQRRTQLPSHQETPGHAGARRPLAQHAGNVHHQTTLTA